jgi:GMP synthase (glutamine-hydrolysing)
MRVHYLQHVSFEGLGNIAPWLDEHGMEVSSTKMYRGEEFPSLDDIDWLMVMGGPMSVHDETAYPWLSAERRFLAEAIDRDKTILGFCLGAQLIADVLGANVYANTEPEIGWFPIERVENASPLDLRRLLPPRMDVFHWHGETFDLPVGAVHLAHSMACENQAFAYGDRVLGLQFHLETTPAGATALVKNCADELVNGRYVEDAASILSRSEQFGQINAVMRSLLEHMRQLAV